MEVLPPDLQKWHLYRGHERSCLQQNNLQRWRPLFTKVHATEMVPLADVEGAGDASPLSPNFLIFMQFSVKIGQIIG